MVNVEKIVLFCSSNSKLKSLIAFQETSHSQIGAISGGVAGTLVLIMIVVVTVFFVHKHYTCNISMKFKKRKSEEVNEVDKDTSLYTNLTDQQQENVEKNMYDELTSNERHYEAVLMKETQGSNEKLYEKLQESQFDGDEGDRNSKESRKLLQSSINDRSMIKAAEEYVNTTFMK